jgi:hypothetical protein
VISIPEMPCKCDIKSPIETQEPKRIERVVISDDSAILIRNPHAIVLMWHVTYTVLRPAVKDDYVAFRKSREFREPPGFLR